MKPGGLEAETWMPGAVEAWQALYLSDPKLNVWIEHRSPEQSPVAVGMGAPAAPAPLCGGARTAAWRPKAQRPWRPGSAPPP